MPFYRNGIYPYLVDKLGDPPPIQVIRRRIIPLAQGDVLEIGVGSGANLIHYRPATVSKLYALEPNPGMRRRADRQRQHTKLTIEFLDLPGEQIPLDNRSIDTVVSTFTLCTIPGIEAALHGIRRVLKPGGVLVFFELGGSPDPAVRRWQNRLEPTCHRLFQGLRLTRDIPALIEQSGFQIADMESGYLAAFPKALTYGWWGTAVRLA
jgi:ubiquinone/menaquinone biosynthesis C-methylase UbiE